MSDQLANAATAQRQTGAAPLTVFAAPANAQPFSSTIGSWGYGGYGAFHAVLWVIILIALILGIIWRLWAATRGSNGS